jgi:hypothetical protein
MPPDARRHIPEGAFLRIIRGEALFCAQGDAGGDYIRLHRPMTSSASS